jgi:hypothetical protein
VISKYDIIHDVSKDVMLALAWHHSGVPGWPGTGPTPRTNRQAEGKATVQVGLAQQKHYLNKSYKARLSILLLSKAYPELGILSP